jgi:hypothetical protein
MQNLYPKRDTAILLNTPSLGIPQKGTTNLEKKVEDGKATGTRSGHGAAGTNDEEEESGQTVREGNTAASPSSQGPARDLRHQKQATWAEVLAAGGVNIPVVFNLFGPPPPRQQC